MTTLDLSNFDADTLDVECMKASGVTGVILGCQRPVVTRQMADKLVVGGMPIIGVYSFLYLGLDSAGQTQAAIDVARDYGVKRVWLDVESTGSNERAGITAEERIAEVGDCVAMVRNAGLEPGIYTGRWYWVPQMSNTTAFSDLPLWHSEYPADRHEVRTVDYGGWTNVAIHQYASDIEVCGRVRDHNYVFEGEEGMTQEEFERLFDKRFEERLAARFPNYLAAAFEKVSYAFSDRDDIPEAPMHFPYKPWLPDIEAARCHHATLPGVARD